MGANTWQMMRHLLFPEAFPALIHAVTITAITLVNYSAMAGTVGGGGLGDLAIRYGYQRFNVSVMLATVLFGINRPITPNGWRSISTTIFAQLGRDCPQIFSRNLGVIMRFLVS